MILPKAPDSYDWQDQDQFRNTLELTLAQIENRLPVGATGTVLIPPVIIGTDPSPTSGAILRVGGSIAAQALLLYNPTGGLIVNISDSGGNTGFEMGRIDGVSGTAFIDFHSGATAVDYDSRISGTGGTGVSGGGSITFTAATVIQLGSEFRIDAASNAHTEFYIGGVRKAGLSVIAADTLRFTDSAGTVKWTAGLGGSTVTLTNPVVDGVVNFATTVTTPGVGGEFSFNNNVIMSGTGDIELIIETTHAAAEPPSVHFLRKSGGAAVASGDYLGADAYFGWDGSAYQQRAAVSAQVDGAVSGGTVPTSLVWATGTSAMLERIRLTSAGDLAMDQTNGGVIKGRPGTNTGTLFSMIGRYTSSVTSVSNSGTGETDLVTATLFANSLDSNARGLRITAWGTNAANANNKTIRCYLGTTVIATTGIIANAANISWRLSLTLLRTGASAEDVTYDFLMSAGTLGSVHSTAAESLTADKTLKITGQSGTGSNDITFLGWLVEYAS